MKNIFGYSNNRSLTINIIFCIIAFVGLVIIPAVIQILLNYVIPYPTFNGIIADFIFIGLLYLMYMKDLNMEAKTYFKDFKNNFKNSFKYYLLGFMGMIFFNIIIAIFLKDVSSNENQVREMLFNNMFITMISISIIAPISEELIFRKSLQPLLKNKWIYILVSGLLFGGAHILTNIMNNAFVITDLIYILPYGSLGASFALMDWESKSTFSSIMIHALHNTCMGLMLIGFHLGGLL